MDLPVTGAELWRCFNIHVPSCNEQLESNVTVSQHRRSPTCDKHPNGRTQTNMKRHVGYVWVPRTAYTGTCGRRVRVYRDTITRGSRESGETSKKDCIIDIKNFPPFPDVAEIWYPLSAACLSKYRSVYNLPISLVLRLPRQSSFILCTFQSRHLLSYRNKWS